MNKKIFKYFNLLILPLLIASCGGNSLTSLNEDGEINIYVLNAEDYIDEDLLTEFSDYIYEKDNKRVNVIYDTYDTNETMYNTLQTGKTSYDLICASDYMIQRLANENYLTKIDHSLTPNYSNYVSKFLVNDDINDLGKLNSLKVNNNEGESTLDEYSLGYMWGTLGILYNPSYILDYNLEAFNNSEEFKDLNEEERLEKIISIFNSDDGYSFLWNDLVKGTTSIKDSMRDTYALGNFEVFKDYYLDESISYEDKLNKFNDSTDETIELVKNKLIELKDYIFGFEVDSGKNDIVTQKIGINLAWSGDAVNSINRGYYADDDWTEPKEDPINLYYSIPSEGANVWMDLFATPTQNIEGYYDSLRYKYTLEFADYLSKPENAVRNVYYNGYTSFIASSINEDIDESLMMLAYMYYSYDLTLGDNETNLEEYDEYDITPFFKMDEEFTLDLSYISSYFEDSEIDDRTFTFNKDENGEIKIIIHTDLDSFEGRLLTAQYPKESEVNRLYVMSDYGSQNDKIVKMWEDVKVNPLPSWITITLIVFLVLFIGYLGSYKLIRIYKIKKRKSYRE